MSPSASVRSHGLLAHVKARRLTALSTPAMRLRSLSIVGWLLMFAGHAPALIAAFQDALGGGSPGRVLLLIASQTFFILKIADVRWLRLPSSPRALFALSAACVLLHAGVVQRMNPAAADAGVAEAVLLVGGATLAASAAASVDRRASAIVVRSQRGAGAALARRSSAADLPPRDLALASRSLSNRAPPLRS